MFCATAAATENAVNNLVTELKDCINGHTGTQPGDAYVFYVYDEAMGNFRRRDYDVPV